MSPGTSCVYKVPPSTITKNDLRVRPAVYLATRVSPASTAIVFCVEKGKLIEVALHDLVVVEMTNETKAKLKKIATSEAARGVGLNLGSGFEAAPASEEGATMRVTRQQTTGEQDTASAVPEERGGEDKGEETLLSPRTETETETATESFVTDVTWNKPLETINGDEESRALALSVLQPTTTTS